MGILKKIGKAIGGIFPGTGRHAAKRAASEANQYAQEASSARKALEERTKKERLKAQKLAIRGIRSRRAASRIRGTVAGESPSYGSMTIG